jgi:hypothetical protein
MWEEEREEEKKNLSYYDVLMDGHLMGGRRLFASPNDRGF